MKRKFSGRRYARRRVKRRRVNRRRYGRGMSRRTGISVVKVCRTAYGGAWTFGTATTNDFWRYNTVTMNQMNNFAELANLFDEYKLCAVKQTWRPRYDSVNAPGAAGTVAQPQAYAHIIMDPESTLTPTGTYNNTALNSFLEQGKVRSRTLNRPFSVYWKPKCSLQAAVGTRRVYSPWLPTSTTTLSFGGYHMFLQQNNFDNTNTNIVLDSYVTFYLMFRGQK